jgi:hypothetical protein
MVELLHVQKKKSFSLFGLEGGTVCATGVVVDRLCHGLSPMLVTVAAELWRPISTGGNVAVDGGGLPLPRRHVWAWKTMERRRKKTKASPHLFEKRKETLPIPLVHC